MQKPADPWQVRSLAQLASRARRESDAALRQARAALGDRRGEPRLVPLPRRFPDDVPGPEPAATGRVPSSRTPPPGPHGAGDA